jgi:SpoVK/Ycf46/Vps4 family AAA+-type ATPase
VTDDATAPYPDSVAHLFDELRRLDALLRTHLEAWWAQHETVDEYRGLYIADETVEQLVYGSSNERGTGKDERTRGRTSDHREAETDQIAAEIEARVTASIAAGLDLRLVRLADDFELEPSEVTVLLVALAPAVDLTYETLYSYLQDDVTKKRPTVALALDLLCTDDRERVAMRALFETDAPLVRHRLLSVENGDAPLLARPLRVDDRIVEFLLGSDAVDPALAGVATYGNPVESDGDELLTATRTTLDNLLARDAPPLLGVSGPTGSGRRAVVDAVCRVRETPRLTVDVAMVPPEAFVDTVERTCREALLGCATLHVANVDAWDGAQLTDAVERFDAFAGAVVLTGREPWRPPRPPSNHAFAAIEMDVPPFTRRQQLWTAALGSEATTVDVDGLATKFRLTPGEIRDAVASARELAAITSEGTLTESLLYRACRERSGPALEALGRKVTPTYTWDDIVLPDDRLTYLREIADRITHRGRVYADWGFEARFSLGRGLVVLFTGPSGTGKTMAAEIIAGDAGLDLYKVDLATVVSKYIGETEKNLGRVFDAAETTDAVLLFDEADALFGTRTEVRDSHDRYANIEVDYLLQRIEEYEGTVILTTNLERNIDDAFRRRLHVSVDFPTPDREARRAIWERVFPAETPVAELDVDFLSTLEFTGGNIKTVALTAAFLAAAADESVTMHHVVHAANREFRKTGRLVDPETFGAYRELVE